MLSQSTECKKSWHLQTRLVYDRCWGVVNSVLLVLVHSKLKLLHKLIFYILYYFIKIFSPFNRVAGIRWLVIGPFTVYDFLSRYLMRYRSKITWKCIYTFCLPKKKSPHCITIA